MSRKAPAVQFYAEDFLNGTRYLTNAEVGLYIRLLAEQVDKGSLPDDVEHFAKAYGKECRKLWPAVRAKFIAGSEPGTIVNERMVAAIAARDAYRLKQSEKGKLSAEARLHSGSTTDKPRKHHGSTVVEPLGDGVGVKSISGKERAELRFPVWSTDKFSEQWKLWKAYKAERGERYKPIGEQSALTKLGKDYPDEAAACAAIEFSMGQNYQGIYPAKQNGAQAPAAPTETPRARGWMEAKPSGS